ncbi:MAG: hypothetical protein U0791_25440 [Gemmataceae bacterium]
MKTRFLRSAKEDVAIIGVKLDSFREGWADVFESELLRAVSTIGDYPRLQPRTEDGPEEPENREYFISRFEIRIIYAIWMNEAVIVALIHARQKPGRWRHRLTELG